MPCPVNPALFLLHFKASLKENHPKNWTPGSHRIQRGLGWKGPKDHLIPAAWTGTLSPRPGCSKPCPTWPWRISDPLWDHCSQLANGPQFLLDLAGQRILAKGSVRRTLCLSAEGTTGELWGLRNENQALCSFTGTFCGGFCLACSVLHVAILHRENC